MCSHWTDLTRFIGCKPQGGGGKSGLDIKDELAGAKGRVPPALLRLGALSRRRPREVWLAFASGDIFLYI